MTSKVLRAARLAPTRKQHHGEQQKQTLLWVYEIKKAWDAGKNTVKSVGDFASGVTESVIKGDWDGVGDQVKDAGEFISSKVTVGAKAIGDSIDSATKPARKFLHDNAGTISSTLGVVSYATAFIPGGQVIAISAGLLATGFAGYSLGKNAIKCSDKYKGNCDPAALAFDALGTVSGAGSLGFKLSSKVLKSEQHLVKSENIDTAGFVSSFASLSVDSIKAGMNYADSRKC